MRAADSATLITPGKIYRALGKRADCGGCLPHFMDIMASCDSLGVPADLRNLRNLRNLRRTTSRRTSQ